MQEDVVQASWTGLESAQFICRELNRIIANPQASAADIDYLRAFNEIRALHHPNCPAALWWQLAATHPVSAKASPLFSLLTLEDPAQWLLLETVEVA